MYLDAHIHLWELNDGEQFWMREKIPSLYKDFTEDDLRGVRAKCNVGGAIVVQVHNTIRETRSWLSRADGSDQIVGVVGWLDLFSDSLEKEVRQYQMASKFVGLRPLPVDPFGSEWLADPRSKAAIKLLQSLDVSVDILQRVENLPRARAFFRQFVDLRLVLDHGGRPAVMTGVLEPWYSEIRAFARETSAVVKISGLVERAGVEWTKESIRPYVAGLIEAFGTKRCMFASNWPVSTIGSRYELWASTLEDILDDLGMAQEGKDDIMWRTASRHYRVKWPA